MSHRHSHHNATDDQARTSYDQFVKFERLMKTYSPPSNQRFNPTPLGLCAFALTTFVVSMYNAGVSIPVGVSHGVVMGVALFYGGLVQLLAGLLEFRVGNNFGALAFCSYGGFWLGYASLYIGSFGFLGNTELRIINNELGIFFVAWAIFTAAMFISSLRTNIALMALFFFLTITFALLSASKFHPENGDIQRAAGAFGILTAAIAWYAAFASLLKQGENSYFSLPVYDLSV